MRTRSSASPAPAQQVRPVPRPPGNRVVAIPEAKESEPGSTTAMDVDTGAQALAAVGTPLKRATRKTNKFWNQETVKIRPYEDVDAPVKPKETTKATAKSKGKAKQQDSQSSTSKVKGKATESKKKDAGKTMSTAVGADREDEDEPEDEPEDDPEDEDDTRPVEGSLGIHDKMQSFLNSHIISYNKINLDNPPKSLAFQKYNPRPYVDASAKLLLTRMRATGFVPFQRDNFIILIMNRKDVGLGCVQLDDTLGSNLPELLLSETGQTLEVIETAGGQHREGAIAQGMADARKQLESAEAEKQLLENSLKGLVDGKRAKVLAALDRVGRERGEAKRFIEDMGWWGVVIYDEGELLSAFPRFLDGVEPLDLHLFILWSCTGTSLLGQ